jgi:thiol-disulfide isomerase/thioredoxin
MKRRNLVTSLVALAAGIGGAALFRVQEKRRAEPLPGDGILWGQEFPSPAEEMIKLSAFKGQPLLLNFWATWCPPCLEEMPLLSRFQRAQGNQGWKVLGLAVDNASAVKAYLKQTPAEFEIGIAGFGGLDLAFELGNRSRQLPFSVLFDRQGRVILRRLGTLTEQDLADLKA